MGWFNWFGRKSKQDNNDSATGADAHLPPEGQPPHTDGFLQRLRPRSKRDRQIATLQEGYYEMLNLVRSISDHLNRQRDVQEQMTTVLKDMPEAMQGLKSVNKAAEQQVEVLNLLRRQLHSSNEHDQQLIQSMANFNRTLGTIGETSRQSESLLRHLIERSERRMMFVVSVMAALIFIGIGTLAYFSASGDLQRWINKKLNRYPMEHTPGTIIEPVIVPAGTESKSRPAPVPAAKTNETKAVAAATNQTASTVKSQPGPFGLRK